VASLSSATKSRTDHRIRPKTKPKTLRGSHRPATARHFQSRRASARIWSRRRLLARRRRPLECFEFRRRQSSRRSSGRAAVRWTAQDGNRQCGRIWAVRCADSPAPSADFECQRVGYRLGQVVGRARTSNSTGSFRYFGIWEPGKYFSTLFLSEQVSF
jgi:hypothetical protein